MLEGDTGQLHEGGQASKSRTAKKEWRPGVVWPVGEGRADTVLPVAVDEYRQEDGSYFQGRTWGRRWKFQWEELLIHYWKTFCPTKAGWAFSSGEL